MTDPTAWALRSREEQIDELLAREQIRDCLLRYTRGIDRQDGELARSAYHPDAQDDHVAFIGLGQDFVEWCNGWHADQFDTTQHSITNVWIEIDGDTAHAESYFILMLRNKGAHDLGYHGGGRYLDRLERRDGRWAIAARVVTLGWMADLESSATVLPLSVPTTQDRDDISYERPLQVHRDDRVLFGPGQDERSW